MKSGERHTSRNVDSIPDVLNLKSDLKVDNMPFCFISVNDVQGSVSQCMKKMYRLKQRKTENSHSRFIRADVLLEE